MSNLRLDFISHADARRAVQRWYYRPDMPMGKLVRFGAWEDEKFVGCIIFGMGACDNLGTRWGLTCFQCSEMLRVAFGKHETAISRIISIALRLLKKQSPGLKAVVSYSDPDADHVGTIYQAMGWIYTGTTAKQRFYIHKKTGEHIHSRRVSATGYKRMIEGMAKTVRVDECDVVITSGKHRYVWTFDEETRKIISRDAIAYPKRAVSDTLDTPGHQPGKGGSLPTTALQTSHA